VRLSSEYLIVFATVAELGSVSRAAERLNLSQPAVSGQLKALQDLVGEALYERHSRGITLTAAGTMLLPQANAVMRSLNRAAESVLELRGRATRDVNLGASWILSASLVPQLFERLSDTPNVRLNLRSDHSEALLTAVNVGELHAALVVDANRNVPEGLEVTRFGEEDIRLIVPTGHALVGTGYVGLHALTDQTVLWPMRGSSVRRRSELALERAGVRPQRSLELGGFLAIKEGLLRNLGVAFLPSSMVRRELEHGQLHSLGIEANGLTLDYCVVAPAWGLLTHPTRLVLEAIMPGVKPNAE
jgi:LysR family transcriptional regulator, low CO2-responsive transcriptional regulator